MNWDAISFDWNQVKAFLATAEEGTLSAAARALGQTQPTLGRQVTSLEDKLGVTLFERTGRNMALTAAGRELLAHVRDMAQAATRVSLAASGQSQEISGKVAITASDINSAFVLPPALIRLRQIAPRLKIEVIADNSIRDLMQREADIAIRHVRPTQPDLIARLIGEVTASFYIAEPYQARYGAPETTDDLHSHHLISFGDPGRMIGHLATLDIHLAPHNFPLISENGLVAWEMARRGLGIAVMADDVARASPGMRRLFPQMAPITFPVWLTTHRELHTSRRIRLVFDTLAEMLAPKG